MPKKRTTSRWPCRIAPTSCDLRAATIVLASLVVAAANAGNARGDVYTFAFTGAVTSVRDGLGAFGPQAAALTSFSGTYTFDTATPPTKPLPPLANEAIYQHLSPPAGVSVRLGDFSFRANEANTDFRVWVRNEFGFTGSDDYGFHSFHNVADGLYGDWPLGILEISWLASTLENDPFADVAMPIVPPDLGTLGSGEFHIFGECFACDVPDPTFEIRGVFTTLTSASGPATGALNADGRVDAADVAMMVREFGWTDDGESAGPSPSDLNADGKVGLADLMMLHANLSPLDAVAANDRAETAAASFAPPSQNVPEPATLAMLVAMAASLTARRLFLRRCQH